MGAILVLMFFVIRRSEYTFLKNVLPKVQLMYEVLH